MAWQGGRHANPLSGVDDLAAHLDFGEDDEANESADNSRINADRPVCNMVLPIARKEGYYMVNVVPLNTTIVFLGAYFSAVAFAMWRMLRFLGFPRLGILCTRSR